MEGGNNIEIEKGFIELLAHLNVDSENIGNLINSQPVKTALHKNTGRVIAAVAALPLYLHWTTNCSGVLIEQICCLII